MVITLGAELAAALDEQARQRGVAGEVLAIEALQDGTYFAHISPPTVTAIVAAIRAFPAGEVIGRLRKSRPEWVRYKKGRDDFTAAFDSIARAYATASAQGAGLTILVC